MVVRGFAELQRDCLAAWEAGERVYPVSPAEYQNVVEQMRWGWIVQGRIAPAFFHPVVNGCFLYVRWVHVWGLVK